MSKNDTELKRLKKRLSNHSKSTRPVINQAPYFTIEDALLIANILKIDFNTVLFTLKDFYDGVNVELEHGTKYAETNITQNDPIMTGKIAYAHLKEFPDYYVRLKKLEDEAKIYWANQPPL
ncbi:MAG: DUF5661 family protein [Clostridium sp.]